jgi:hypothetical protein
MRSFPAVVFLAVVLVSCSRAPDPGSFAPGDIRRLTGPWRGEWRSDSEGRKGRLVFELSPGEASVRGDMMFHMIENPERIQVRFVRTDPDAFEGKSHSFQDDICRCTVSTTFVGREYGDTLRGSFATREEGTMRTRSGTWWVVRKESDDD